MARIKQQAERPQLRPQRWVLRLALLVALALAGMAYWLELDVGLLLRLLLASLAFVALVALLGVLGAALLRLLRR